MTSDQEKCDMGEARSSNSDGTLCTTCMLVVVRMRTLDTVLWYAWSTAAIVHVIGFEDLCTSATCVLAEHTSFARAQNNPTLL